MARSAVTKGRLAKIAGEVGIEGLDEIKANIAAKLDKLTGQKAKKVFMGAGMILVKEAQDLAPVKTGRLRDAIHAAYGDPRKPNVLVGVNYKKAPHAHLVEYGTSHASAHPYMRPAIAATRGAMGATIVEGLRDLAVEDEGD